MAIMGILSQVMSIGSSLLGMLGMGGNNKARFLVEGASSPLYVQFNPEAYSVSETVNYRQVSAQGTEKDVTQYVGSVKSVANLSFYFDTDSVLSTNPMEVKKATDVSALTTHFSNLLRVNGELHRPPIVAFAWGSISISGFITQVDTRFTMFDSRGVPVRAKVDCTLVSVGDSSAIKRSPLMSPDRTKSRVMSEDTNIWAIAELEYGDINKWRLIAKANDIMDPMDIPAGTILRVPAITD
jgi:hypothetical protein